MKSRGKRISLQPDPYPRLRRELADRFAKPNRFVDLEQFGTAVLLPSRHSFLPAATEPLECKPTD